MSHPAHFHPAHFHLSTLFVVALVSSQLSADARTREDYFEQSVRPLLESRCFSCHGEHKQESDLRLDSRVSILQGGASGKSAANLSDPASSRVLRFVRREVEGMEMPPDRPLSNREVEILERWIKDGLAWPEEPVAVSVNMETRLHTHRADHWAVQAPVIGRLDKNRWPSSLLAWPQTRLDEFVADKLASHELTPSSEADRRVLIRRLKFDLLGLPPTPHEVNAFVNDTSPDAYSKVLDRYLASPHYGERWGRHWLDVARYSDTRGYAFARDRNYPFAYTYRDYVIDALNRDLRFDEFVVQQLAADLLELPEDNRALAGLGFLTVGRRFNNTHDDIDDRIDVVTRGFLGLTVACARCHDHKYDAIPTEDYYALYGVFASTQEPSRLPLIGDAETRAVSQAYEQRYDAASSDLSDFDTSKHTAITAHAHSRIADYLSEIIAPTEATTCASEALLKPLTEGWRRLLKQKATDDDPTWMPWHRLQSAADGTFSSTAEQLAQELQTGNLAFLNPMVRDAFVESPPTTKPQLAELYGRVFQAAYEIWQKAGGDRSARSRQPPEVRQLLWYYSDPNSPAVIPKDRIHRYLSDLEKQERDKLAERVESIRQTMPKGYHRAMVLQDKSQPVEPRVFIRGDATRPGTTVARRGLTLMHGDDPTSYTRGSGRLQMAKEIASDRNPLAARVFVNRVWMHHFGQPLVDTPSDFGIRCTEPLQLQLLDYLAVTFMNHGWSIKALHREIALSATYRQSSGDHERHYKEDPENRLFWRFNRRRLEFEALRDAMLLVSGQLDRTMGGAAVRLFERPEDGARRSVYGYIDRQDLPNLLRVFDFASPDQSAAKRTRTTVPQQALFLLNSPFVAQQTQRLVQRFASTDDQEFVDVLYRTLFSRPPSSTETQISLDFLHTTDTQRQPMTSRTQLGQLLLLTNEFCHVD